MSQESPTSRALMHLAAAINHGESAFRGLPDVDGPHHCPAVRIRKDVQFHLNNAGRSLGNAYDALRTLAEIINGKKGE